LLIAGRGGWKPVSVDSNKLGSGTLKFRIDVPLGL
jgi:hypothetical protein